MTSVLFCGQEVKCRASQKNAELDAKLYKSNGVEKVVRTQSEKLPGQASSSESSVCTPSASFVRHKLQRVVQELGSQPALSSGLFLCES